jgi:hypothetical protein
MLETRLRGSETQIYFLMRIRDVHIGSPIMIFFHSGFNNIKKRGEGNKTFGLTFFCSHKFYELKTSLFLKITEKNSSQLTKNLVLLTQTLLISSQKYGSGFRDPEIWEKLRYHGSRIRIQRVKKGTGSRIRICNTVYFHMRTCAGRVLRERSAGAVDAG